MIALPEPTRLTSWDAIRVALSGVRGRPTRAVLSALGVAIGIAAMVAVLGIGDTSQAGLLAQIRTLGTDMLTVTPGQSLLGENARLPADAVGMISRIPGVTSVSAVGVVPGVSVRRSDLIDPRETGGISVQATRLDLLSALGGSVASGAWFNAATARYPAVVLGAVAAERLGVAHAGAKVFVAGSWWTVSGVLSPLPLAPGIDRSALIGWSAAEDLLAFDGHPTTVYERSGEAAVAQVWSLLPATANPEHPDQVAVSRPSDALTAQLAVTSAFNTLLLGLGAVALVVGGVGIANIMVISVLERRQEIGLRRSLGATRGHIRLQFLAESVALSILGGVTGAGAGLAITLGYATYRDWPLVLPGQALLGGVLTAIAVGALAGLYPARRASRLTPTQALATG